LSTHIVEDVSTLCANFAIICQGEVLYTGEPENAVKAMEGKIFTKAISKNELAHYQDDFMVISTQLKSGKLHIRICQDVVPGEGFVQIAPNLEDVYFSNIAAKIDVNTL
jgi:ABC-type multidrug transport system ATPase subunit